MTDEKLAAALPHQLVERFGVDQEQVKLVWAPYRICPLGAHIDHQLGQVTAMALERGVYLAFAPTPRREARLQSLDFPGEVSVDFDHIVEQQPGDWGNYLRGAVQALERRHRLQTGLVGITAGRVAEGGLSSSAAVSAAYLLALEHINQLAATANENIRWVQEIENEYLGLKTGILDQSAILLSRAGCLTVVDCRDVSYQLIEPSSSLPPYRILIVFSGIRKSLAGTDYNQRVSECAQAARILLDAAAQSSDPAVLGRVNPEQYERYRHRLAGAAARRAEHFFSEMDRVRRGTRAWQRGDLQEFGELMTQSGASSIANYECGAPALIDLYHTLVETPGVYGARFSGAGFRGCCLALVPAEQAEEIAARVHEIYNRQHPNLCKIPGRCCVSRAMVRVFWSDSRSPQAVAALGQRAGAAGHLSHHLPQTVASVATSLRRLLVRVKLRYRFGEVRVEIEQFLHGVKNDPLLLPTAAPQGGGKLIGQSSEFGMWIDALHDFFARLFLPQATQSPNHLHIGIRLGHIVMRMAVDQQQLLAFQIVQDDREWPTIDLAGNRATLSPRRSPFEIGKSCNLNPADHQMEFASSVDNVRICCGIGRQIRLCRGPHHQTVGQRLVQTTCRLCQHEQHKCQAVYRFLVLNMNHVLRIASESRILPIFRSLYGNRSDLHMLKAGKEIKNPLGYWIEEFGEVVEPEHFRLGDTLHNLLALMGIFRRCHRFFAQHHQRLAIVPPQQCVHGGGTSLGVQSQVKQVGLLAIELLLVFKLRDTVQVQVERRCCRVIDADVELQLAGGIDELTPDVAPSSGDGQRRDGFRRHYTLLASLLPTVVDRANEGGQTRMSRSAGAMEC